MLKTVFEQVLVLSAVGSAVILVLFLLRPVTAKQFSPKWQYYIWLLALNTLVLPLPKPVAKVVYLPQNHPLFPVENTPIKQLSQVLVEPRNTSVDWLQVLAVVWAVGVLFSVALKLTRYTVFQGTLLQNSKEDTIGATLPKRLRVRRTWLLDAPLLIGMLRPTLYLPESVSDKDLSYILAHELMHYKRRDLLFKWYAQTVFSIHWFNPLMLLLSRQVDAECEASCDFEVTRNWSREETARYMSMILERCSETAPKRLLTTHMASGKRVIKRRFFAILDGKKGGWKRRMTSCALALVLLCMTQMFGVSLAKALWQETKVIPVTVAALPEPQKEIPEEAEVSTEPPTPPSPQPIPQEDLGTEVVGTEQTVGALAPVPAPTEKILAYNSDERVVQTTTVYPDEEGNIRVRFNSSDPRAIVELEIRNVNHPGGWGYNLPTDPATVYEFGGFDPDAAYAVTVNAYCPGNYGILGSVSIY